MNYVITIFHIFNDYIIYMQREAKILILLFIIFSIHTSAQSTFINLGNRDNHFLDRVEIKYNKIGNFNFTTVKPFSRNFLMQQINLVDSQHLNSINKIDKYNFESLYMNNIEWVNPASSFFKSKRSLIKSLYVTKANLFEIKNEDLFLCINPIINIQYGHESGYGKELFINTRGLTMRGVIGNKIGFSSTITDNQERGPQFFQQLVSQYKAVPGVGFYKDFKEDISANDYFDGRGYITFNSGKFIDFQLGFDKNFIGNGYRSLFLSDNANSNLFAKINTRLWKFNYQNLYMELMPQFKKKGDLLLKRKFAVIHHLSIDVTKKLNIGLFESVMMSRSDHIDFEYLNPIIFYRHIEGNVGSPDNALAGFDFKYNIQRKIQVYGQLLLDEFVLSKIKNEPSNWVNKFGYQLGAKYIDAFSIRNLDLQIEMNRVRPFTYSHNDTICNYTHYNQPLAHPLGANFQELIGVISFQASPRLNLYARGIYYYKGMDSSSQSYGGNIFRSYNARGKQNNGFYVGSGNKIHCLNLLLNASYEIKRNLFFDAGFLLRNNKLQNQKISNSASVFNVGIRLNITRREYDY